MAYIPNISDYKPFYIQTTSDTTAQNTTQWGLVAKSNPYPVLPTPKEPFKNEWKDENGDDEYTTSMHYEAMEFSVGFYIKTYAANSKTAVQILHEQIDTFFNKIKSGVFKTYDSYAGLGFQNVRYNGYKEDDFVARDDWARLLLTVDFKANDPLTRITISNNTLVEEE